MTIGKIFKLTLYAFIIIVSLAAIIGYIMKIMPTSFGIHSIIYTSKSIALDSYDVVNYYDKKKANKGDVTFNYKLDDVNWFFTSGQHMRLFKATPNKYIPQFGGYCVYTISKGYTHPPDLNSWHLEKGKLYFFSDEQTKKLALADWKNVLSNAQLNWK